MRRDVVESNHQKPAPSSLPPKLLQKPAGISRPYDPFAVPTAEDGRPCFIFGGGGWRGIWFCGVLKYLQEHFSVEELRSWAFCGESAGSAAALVCCLGIPWQQYADGIKHSSAIARSRASGWLMQCDVLGMSVLNKLMEDMPESEVLARVNGRWGVTISVLDQGQRGQSRLSSRLLTSWATKQEVLQSVRGSAFLPPASSPLNTVRIGGWTALDGGLTTQGCLPLLSGFFPIHAICCGDPAPLPDSITLDIAPSPPVSVLTMFHNPRSDSQADATVWDGYHRTAHYFQHSRRWAAHRSLTHPSPGPSPGPHPDKPDTYFEGGHAKMKAGGGGDYDGDAEFAGNLSRAVMEAREAMEAAKCAKAAFERQSKAVLESMEGNRGSCLHCVPGYPCRHKGQAKCATNRK